MRPIRGTGYSGFSIPEDLEYKKVSTVDEMEKPDETYRFPSKEAVVIVNRNAFAIAECAVEGETLPDMAPAIEQKAHLRLTGAEILSDVYDQDRKIRKTVYNCVAEGLFSDLIYNDYYGFLSVIQKEGKASVLFAGTTGSQDGLDSIIGSHWYKEYKEYANAVIPKGRENPALTEETIGLGEQGIAEILYRSRSGCSVQRIGITLEGVEHNAEKMILSKMEGRLPVEELPKLEEGYSWQIATFHIDGMGLDFSHSKPDLRIRYMDQYGKLYPAGILYQTKDKIQVFYPLNNDNPSEFVVGYEEKLKIATKGS